MKIENLLDIVSYDDAYNSYVVEKLTISECAKKFGLSVPQFENVIYWYHLQIDKYGQFKSVLDKINGDIFVEDCKQLCAKELVKKYNLSYHHLCKLKLYYHIIISPEDTQRFAKREQAKLTKEQKQLAVQKCNESKIKHYGSLEECNRQSYLKQQQTCLERYGVTNAAYVPGAQDKKRNTNMLIYGTPVSSQAECVKEKSKQTRINNFGSLEASYEHGVMVQSERCMEKEGVPYYLLTQRCHLAQRKYKKYSTLNEKFEKFLISNDITNFICEYYIPSYFYDFKIDNLLIEIDPYFTHCSTQLFDSHGCVDKYYHQNKTKTAQNEGFYCLHVFDWMSWDSIIEFIKLNTYRLYDCFEEPRQYVYNYKTNQLQTKLTDNCVIIYDDGGVYLGQ